MRLFLALPLPEEVREAIRGLQDEMRPRSEGWRWTKPESVHLTLRFLGEMSEESLEAQKPIWRDTAARGLPMRLVFGGIGRFPGGGAPSVLWLGAVEDPPEGRLASLAAALEGAAVALGLPPERRPFRPHLTLARAAGRRRPSHIESRGSSAALCAARFQDIVLFRSVLSPAGAAHTPLESFPLGVGGRHGC